MSSPSIPPLSPMPSTPAQPPWTVDILPKNLFVARGLRTAESSRGSHLTSRVVLPAAAGTRLPRRAAQASSLASPTLACKLLASRLSPDARRARNRFHCSCMVLQGTRWRRRWGVVLRSMVRPCMRDSDIEDWLVVDVRRVKYCEGV